MNPSAQSRRTQPACPSAALSDAIADELRRQADTFIELADIQKDIQRAGGQKRPARDDAGPIDDDLPLLDDDEYDELDDADDYDVADGALDQP